MPEPSPTVVAAEEAPPSPWDEEGEEGEMDLAASIRSASILMADGLGSRLYTLESHSHLEGQWNLEGQTLGGTLSDTASEGSADDVGAALEAEAERAKVAAEIQHALEEQETRHALSLIHI